MTSSTTGVAIAQLVTNLILAIIIGYLLFAHGKKGILGFLFLLIFCSLQVVSAGLQISNSASTTAATLSSVGLSPLILAAEGILHKAHFYLSSKPSETSILKVAFQIFVHILAIAGVALNAIGSSNLSKDSGTSKYHTDLTHRKIGSIILLLAFFCVVAHTALLFLKYWASKKSMAKRLLYSTAPALVLLFVRLIYAMVYSFASPNSHTFKSLNPITASIAIRVIFLFLMLFFASLSLTIGGLASRRLRKSAYSGPPHYDSEFGNELTNTTSK